MLPHGDRAGRSRPGRRLLVALLALAALAAGAAPAASAAVPRDFFGISARVPDSQDFQVMGNGGLGSIRLAIGWRTAQTSRNGDFRWDFFDREFQHAAANGLRPIPFLWGTPEFIAKDPTKILPPVRTRQDREAWQRFVRAAIARYGPGGQFWAENPYLEAGLAPRDWLIWNEQNARAFWRPGVDPSEYARLLKLSRRAMDEVDPSMRIVVGGMYGYPNHEKSMKMKAFMKRLYHRKGMRALIDGVSLHPYGKNLKEVRRQVVIARRLMNKAHDRSARIWIGEVGWASGGDEHELVKSKPLQAKLLQKSYSMFLSKRQKWKIPTVFWYLWRDFNEQGTCPWCAKAGLLTRAGDPKPAWNAYRILIANRT